MYVLRPLKCIEAPDTTRRALFLWHSAIASISCAAHLETNARQRGRRLYAAHLLRAPR